MKKIRRKKKRHCQWRSSSEILPKSSIISNSRFKIHQLKVCFVLRRTDKTIVCQHTSESNGAKFANRSFYWAHHQRCKKSTKNDSDYKCYFEVNSQIVHNLKVYLVQNRPAGRRSKSQDCNCRDRRKRNSSRNRPRRSRSDSRSRSRKYRHHRTHRSRSISPGHRVKHRR